MSRPENSKRPEVTQQPTLSALVFGGVDENLFEIIAGGNMDHGIDLARDLAEGVQQLCARLDFATNYGEVCYCAELRAVSFLSGTVAALLRSAQRKHEDAQ
ncbi:MAG: hypothetical protein WBZ57_00610 [Pseudomonas graminis]